MINFTIWDTFTNQEFDEYVNILSTLGTVEKTEDFDDTSKYISLKWTSDNDVKNIIVNFNYESEYIDIYGEYNIFEDDVWTRDNVDYILLTFYDFKSAWNWVTDTDYSIEKIDWLMKLFWNVDGGVQYPVDDELLETLQCKNLDNMYD